MRYLRRYLLLAATIIIPGLATPMRAQDTSTVRRVQTAQDSVLESRTSDLARQLRCPVCQGLSIQDSPSELSQSMRSVVRDQLAAGKTPDEVKSYFVSKYGEWILLAPEAHGFNLVAYALPVLVVIGGCLLIAIAVKRWTTPATDAASPDQTPH